MSLILTVRLTPQEIGECDARAAQMGLTRTDYIRHLLRTAAQPGTRKRGRRRFRSTDLIGTFSVGTGSSNAAVRAALARRAREQPR